MVATPSPDGLSPEEKAAITRHRRRAGCADGQRSGAPRTSAREVILALATEHFRRGGFQAVAVADVLCGSGFTKPTLYHHFGSKEGLIVACVLGECSRIAEKIRDVRLGRAADLESRTRKVIGVLAGEVIDQRRHGLLALAAAVEFRDPAGEVRKAVETGLGMLRAELIQVFEQVLVGQASALAERILMLAQGAGLSGMCQGYWSAAGTLEQAAVEIAGSFVQNAPKQAHACRCSAN